MRILLVEDETKMAVLLRRGLQEEGYAVDVTERAEEAVWMGIENPYDVIVLDVMLPDGNGFDVLRRLRAAKGDTEVTVKSVIRQPGAESLSMDYDMEKTATGWKVFDIKIDGVSLIKTYQESFAGKIRDGGVDALIKALHFMY